MTILRITGAALNDPNILKTKLIGHLHVAQTITGATRAQLSNEKTKTVFGDKWSSLAYPETQMLLRQNGRSTITARLTNAALKRVDEGTFGICTQCGNDIGTKRLLAKPLAERCIACQSLIEDEVRSFAPRFRPPEFAHL